MSKDLEVLRMRLKSGEYDGVHIMKAWIAIEELIQLREELETLKAKSISREAVIEWVNSKSPEVISNPEDELCGFSREYICAYDLIEFLNPQAADKKDSEL